MKSRITKLLALAVACLMMVQVLPAAAAAELSFEEFLSGETVSVTLQDIPESDVHQTETENEPANEPIPSPDEGLPPVETEPDNTGSKQADNPDDTGLPDAGEALPIGTDEGGDSDSESPESGSAESQDEESLPVLQEETADPAETEEPDEIDFEPIEPEPGMEFEDVFESWPEMSLEEEVETLYDGSWIKYAIYNEGHAYVRIRRAAHVYSDTDLEDKDMICQVCDTDVLLLATEHCQRWNTVSIHVCFMTPDMEIIDGYILEDDLVNEAYPDEMAIDLASETDHEEIRVGKLTLPVFIADVRFPENADESDTTEAFDVQESIVDDSKGEDIPVPEIAEEPVESEVSEPVIQAETSDEAEGSAEPVLRSPSLRLSRSAAGLSEGQSVTVYRGDDLQRYVRARDGSPTTATYRHSVTLTVNGTERTFHAVCLNSSRSSSTAGITGTLVSGFDYNPLGRTMTEVQKAKADGILWILIESDFTDPFDAAIAQWAVWEYGGSDDYASPVAPVDYLAAGNGYQYDTETMRQRISALVDGAVSFVESGGVPDTYVSASVQEVLRTDDEHSLATVQLNSNGSKCRIAKSQLLSCTVTGYASQDDTYYYFQPRASFTLDFTDEEVSFDIDAWTRYDQYEYWVGDVSGTFQDMGFIVYTGGTGATSRLTVHAAKPTVQGRIEIIKTDSLTHQPIPGVEFTVERIDEENGNETVAVLITGVDGRAVSDLLPWGEYRIYESYVHQGYLDEEYTATVWIN